MAEKSGLFSRIRDGLTRTRDALSQKINNLISYYREMDDDFFEELTDALIASDMGLATAAGLTEQVRARVRAEKIGDPARVRELLRDAIAAMTGGSPPEVTFPAVITMVGVNGTGKTTAAGKLAYYYKSRGHSVLMAAADTFRAAAAEQLEVWARRAGVPMIRHQEGSDPAAVVFDALSSANARGTELVISDTAGRLHNKKNLMQELEKIDRVTRREAPDRSHEVFLVIDATIGQNAMEQARVFSQVIAVTGLVLTKLDSTAKGGVAVAISAQLGVPIRFIGIGEGIEDLLPFDPAAYASAIAGI